MYNINKKVVLTENLVIRFKPIGSARYLGLDCLLSPQNLVGEGMIYAGTTGYGDWMPCNIFQDDKKVGTGEYRGEKQIIFTVPLNKLVW